MTASSTTSAKLDTLTNAVNKNRTNCGHHYTEHHSMFNNTQTIPRKRSISPAEGHVHHLRKRANIRSRHALVILLVESPDVNPHANTEQIWNGLHHLNVHVMWKKG
eukprot:712931_1